MPKYPSLPVMQCDTNCGECCGPVMATEGEFTAIEQYAAKNGLSPVKQGLTCPWYQGGQCTVHEVRPALCRLFGHSPRMNCPHGYNVNIGGTLLRKWNEKVGGASRFLHEAIEGWTVEDLKVADRRSALGLQMVSRRGGPITNESET